MKDEEIAAVARAEFEQLEGPDGGSAYRCAAVLKDGVFLPCVLLASRDSRVSLALRRFEETRTDAELPAGQRRFGHGMQYQDIVEVFVAGGNRVNSYDIERLVASRFAIPAARLIEVQGETRMGWTEFSAVMSDGKEFGFGTSYSMEFFDMPEGYAGDDVKRIVSHKRLEPIHRERPYFTCWVASL